MIPGAEILEQRKTERRSLRVPALLLLPGGRSFAVQTLDISLGGLGVLAPANAPQGARLSVRLELPVKPAGRATLEAPVVVVHSVLSRDHDAFKVGMQFERLEPAGESAIRHYIASHG